MKEQCQWLNHDLWVHPKGTNWASKPGVYVFAAKNPHGQWFPVYIGQADSLSDRIPNHERWDEAVRHGATHVHAMVVSSQVERDRIEAALIAAYQPNLNTHHR